MKYITPSLSVVDGIHSSVTLCWSSCFLPPCPDLLCPWKLFLSWETATYSDAQCHPVHGTLGLNTPGSYFSIAMGREYLCFSRKEGKILFFFLLADFHKRRLLVSWRKAIGTRRGAMGLPLLWCSIEFTCIKFWSEGWHEVANWRSHEWHTELRCPLQMQRCWLHSERKSWEQLGNQVGMVDQRVGGGRIA